MRIPFTSRLACYFQKDNPHVPLMTVYLDCARSAYLEGDMTGYAWYAKGYQEKKDLALVWERLEKFWWETFAEKGGSCPDW